MIRDKVVPKGFRGERRFRWRGGDVSRIESLSDAVFALALTLIVVSLDVPATFGELTAAFGQLPGFAFCFTMLVMCWYYHYLFHRRYGLEDLATVVLNALLLFLILFYVYPLKFVVTILPDLFRDRSIPTVRSADGTAVPVIAPDDLGILMLRYGAGLVGVYAVLALLERHALKRSAELELDEAELAQGRGAMRGHLIFVLVGLLSMGLAIVPIPFAPMWAGFSYFLLWPLHFWNGRRVERALAALDG